MKGKLTRRGSIAVMAVLGVLAAVGVGYGAIPSGDGVIHSCYNASSGSSASPSGQLRVVDSDTGAKCARNEKALDFNQKGPQGEKGDKGDKGDACLPTNPACVGPKGDTGEAGPKGDSGSSEAFSETNLTPTQIQHDVAVAISKDVPAGSYVINAKADLVNGSLDQEANSDCSLRADRALRDTHSEIVEPSDVAPLVLQGVMANFGGGSITVECRAADSGTFYVVRPTLTAIKVSAIR